MDMYSASGNLQFASKLLTFFGLSSRQFWQSFLPKSALACQLRTSQLFRTFLRVVALA